jgi:hypothetical protein
VGNAAQVLNLLALLAQKYKYWRSRKRIGTRFTCFTSTKVQILTQQEERRYSGGYKGVRESTYRGSGGGSRYDDRRGDRSRHQFFFLLLFYFFVLFCRCGATRAVCRVLLEWSACLFFY